MNNREEHRTDIVWAMTVYTAAVVNQERATVELREAERILWKALDAVIADAPQSRPERT